MSQGHDKVSNNDYAISEDSLTWYSDNHKFIRLVHVPGCCTCYKGLIYANTFEKENISF